jgi:hypothetical protein
MSDSYAYCTGGELIDWPKLLKQPRARFSEDLKWFARDWKSCPIGQLSHRLIERATGGAPTDPTLLRAGIEFCGHIEKDRWEEAKAALEKIHWRAKTLIAHRMDEIQRERLAWK